MLCLKGTNEGHKKQVCTAQCKFSPGNAVLLLLTPGHMLVLGIMGDLQTLPVAGEIRACLEAVTL